MKKLFTNYIIIIINIIKIKKRKILYEENIKELKENNAIILAHYYQMPEIQDIADYR